MKKITNNREKVLAMVKRMLEDMEGYELIELWNNRWAYGKDLLSVVKDKIAYRVDEFDYICEKRRLTPSSIAFMVRCYHNPPEETEYFIADVENNNLCFFNDDDSEEYISIKKLAEYMTDYVDGCGDKIIQAFLDAVATVEEA